MKIASTLGILGLFTAIGSTQIINFSDPLTSANSYWNYGDGNSGGIVPAFSSAGMTFTAVGQNQSGIVSLIMPSTDGTIPSSFSDNFNAEINFDFTSSLGEMIFTVGNTQFLYQDDDGAGLELLALDGKSAGDQSNNFGDAGKIDLNDVNGSLTVSINDTALFTGDTSDGVTQLNLYYSVTAASVTFNDFSLESTPEPGTCALAGVSSLGLMFLRKKFSK